MNERNQEWFDLIKQCKGYLVEVKLFPLQVNGVFETSVDFEKNIQAWIDLLNTIPFVTARRNTEADKTQKPIAVYAPISLKDILNIMKGNGFGKSKCMLDLDDAGLWTLIDENDIEDNTNITMWLGEYPSWQKFYRGLHHRVQNIFNSRVIHIMESIGADATWKDFYNKLTISLK